jgi:hypothetical protein
MDKVTKKQCLMNIKDLLSKGNATALASSICLMAIVTQASSKKAICMAKDSINILMAKEFMVIS